MQISIQQLSIQGWQGSSNVALRINTDVGFTSSNGNVWPQTKRDNPASLGTFYQQFTCTVSGTELTIPAFTLDSTQDSVDNPTATYTAQFIDLSSGQVIQHFGGPFGVSPVNTSTTWAAIFEVSDNA